MPSWWITQNNIPLSEFIRSLKACIKADPNGKYNDKHTYQEVLNWVTTQKEKQ